MKIAVIGSGFSGISAAAYLAKEGHEVHVFEKNSSLGGRARQFSTDNGYTFDMGPSWYWMPDIIENFFSDFGFASSDFYKLVGLDPQFEMVFRDGVVGVPAEFESMKSLFESIEAGAGEELVRFMEAAEYKYNVGMRDFVNRPCHSWWEFVSLKIATSAVKLDLLSDFSSYVRKFFKHPKLISLMEFPVIFLGAMPEDIPALYSLMNYGGYKLGTWYPIGGFVKIIEGMAAVAQKQGVKFHLNAQINKINVAGDVAVGLMIGDKWADFDAVVSSADYHHTEKQLLDEKYRNYSEKYWESRVFAPSSLIYYLGFKERVPNLKHHTLFFENDLDLHASEIYKDKKWPTAPLFYTCCPSQTDRSVAPDGHENVFLLMPLATGLSDTEEVREKYFNDMVQRLEKHTGKSNLHALIDFKRSYCVNDFIADYNAFQGNAYGLANTLKQTAVGKPAIRNKKIKNLFYTGQLTVPGPGVPPAIISGKIVAGELNRLTL
jgi:phytoene desaturase